MTHLNDKLHMPEGVGIYMRAIDKDTHGSPAEAAKRAKDHGVSFVAIMSCWQDIHGGKFRQIDANRRRDRIQRYSEAFANEGIDPWVWGYPWAGHEEEYIDSLFAPDSFIPGLTVGVIHDPELGAKWKNRAKRTRGATMRGQPEAIVGVNASGGEKVRRRQADKVMSLTLDRLPSSGKRGYVTTSYGIARYHKNFPWKEYLQFGGFSPQLYKESLKAIDRAIEEWLAFWRKATGLPDEQAHIMPSVAAYGEKAQLHMRRYLASFLLSKHPIAAILVWSWRQIDRREWRELNRFSEDLKDGATRIVTP